MEQRLKQLEDKIDSLSGQVDMIVGAIRAIHKNQKEAIAQINGNFEQVDSNFKDLSNKVDNIEEKVSKLSSDTGDNFKDVKLELKKISRITRYDEEYNNLMQVVGE